MSISSFIIKKMGRYRKQTKELREWKDSVKDRDKRMCVICGRKDRLNAHHIYPWEIKELRHHKLNGISLCPLHHKLGTYSAHKNSLWFIKKMFAIRSRQFKELMEWDIDEHTCVYKPIEPKRDIRQLDIRLH